MIPPLAAINRSLAPAGLLLLVANGASGDTRDVGARGEGRAPGTPLFESPRDRAARLQATEEARLGESLSWLPGVLRARVHLARPARHGLDGPSEPARAVAFLELSARPTAPEKGAPDPVELRLRARRALAAAVPGLEPEAVEVVLAPGLREPSPTSPVATTQVGPFRVRHADAQRLRWTLALLLALNAALAIGLAVAWRRNR